MPHHSRGLFSNFLVVGVASCWIICTIIATNSQLASAQSCGCTAQSSGRRRRSVGDNMRDEVPPEDGAVGSMFYSGDFDKGQRAAAAATSEGGNSGDGRQSTTASSYINCQDPWPGGILRYRFETGYSSSSRALVRQSLANLQSRIGNNLVTFQEASYFIGYAHVTVTSGTSCSSYIGKVTSSGSQDLTLSETDCMLESIIQAVFMLALGLSSEHKRSDRDSYIDISWNDIQSSACTNFHKNSYLIPSDYPGYDYHSIMHYTSYAFACNSSVPVLRMKNGTTIDNRNNLTDTDVAKLRYVYSSSNLNFCFATTTTTTTTSTTTTRRRSAGSTIHARWMVVAFSVITAISAVLVGAK